MSSYRQQAPSSLNASSSREASVMTLDEDYDYSPSASPLTSSGKKYNNNNNHDSSMIYKNTSSRFHDESYSSQLPPPQSPAGQSSGSSGKNNNNTLDGDEALLDLAQLEELHKEAEKMKALGNKHMATQVCIHCVFCFDDRVILALFAELFLKTCDTRLTLSPSPLFSGIYASLQRVLGGPPAITRWSVVSCLLVEPRRRLAFAETLQCSCHGRSSGDCTGTNLWQGLR
jgi:hypothetical protein